MRLSTVTDKNAARPRAGLFIEDEQLIRQARPLLEAGGMTVSAEAGNGQASFEKLPSGELTKLSGVVFDLRGQFDVLSKARELLDGCRPGAAVVVLGKENDLGVYRSLKDIGVSDYFAYPVKPDELADSVLGTLGLAGGKGRGRGRVVAVHGVCGGLGSGLISAGLGAALAERYERDTALVDTCLGSPAIESYLGVNSPGNLGILLEAEERLDKVLLDQIVIRPMDHLTLLTGITSPEERGSAAPETFRRLADLLGERHRYQIWRSQPGGPMEAPLLSEAYQVVLLT